MLTSFLEWLKIPNLAPSLTLFDILQINVCIVSVVICWTQAAGLTALCIGIYARLDNEYADLMSRLPIVPALLLIAVGAVVSFVGFVGSLGAIRESFYLLKMVISFTNI